MKSWISAALVAAALTTMLAGTATAESDGETKVHQVTTRRVTPAETAAVFPKAAFDQKISGSAALNCTADNDGREVDCRIVKEDPAGMGFGQAALALVTKERVKTTDSKGASIVGQRFETSFSFLAPGDSDSDWIRKPTTENLAEAFPSAAAKQGVDGSATINCKVTVEGFLQACKPVAEHPEGLGFGAAAVLLSSQFRMSPKIRGGKAVEGEVTIPLIWKGFTGYKPPPQDIISLVVDPPWVKVPTAAQVKAAWPSKTGDTASGQVMFRCDLGRDGKLRSCDTVAETPPSLGFSRAARELLPLFQVNVSPETKTTRYRVDVPFRFRAPSAVDGRKITNPTWVRTLTPESMASLYPKAALAAGTFKGLGVVACIVDAAGNLTACKVQRETPANLGFGDAAVAAAQLMGMNPWSREGDPMDGLSLVLPIRFEADEPPPPAKP